MSLNAEHEPIVVKYHRHKSAGRAVLFDASLDIRSIDELRDWAARKVDFVVIDTETGADITRILLA
jgi:polyhydroxyalkanoate synthesis regulator protein